MVGYALSGFAEGFMRGRNQKYAWEDRELDRERQKRLDAMTEEQHRANMARYDREAADWKTANDLRTAEMGVFQDAYDAASEGEATPSTKTAPPPLPGANGPHQRPFRRPSASPHQASEGMGVIPAGETASAAEAEIAQQAIEEANKVARRPDMDYSPPTVAASMLRNGDPRIITEGMMIPQQPAPSGPSARAAQSVPQGATGYREMGANPAPTPAETQTPRRRAISEAWGNVVEAAPERGAMEPNPDHRFMRPGGLASDVGEAGKRIVTGGKNLVLGAVQGAADAVNWTINPYVKYATGYEFPTSRPNPLEKTADAEKAPGGDKAPQVDPSKPVPPISTKPVPGASAAETKAIDGAAEAINAGVSAPASDAARATVQELGLEPGETVTPKQYEKASSSFMDRYIEVGAPKIVEHYLKTGQVEKAARFMDFIDGVKIRENMKDWGVAAAAIAVGDVDKALDTILDAYKRTDYFDDDTEIVRDKSGIIRDKEGNPSGVRLTFRDPKTGTTFEQVYDDIEDAIALGMTLMDPLTAFEHMEKRAQAQAEASLGVQEKMLDKTDDLRKDIMKFTEMIYEGSKQIDGTYSKTPQQAFREAQEMVLGGGEPAKPDAWRDEEAWSLPDR